MRRLVLVACVLPLVAGCGWTSYSGAGSGSGTGPSQAFHGCVVVSPDGTHRPCRRTDSVGSGITKDVHRWVKKENLPANAVPGARLFATAGCTACHTYLGSGSTNLGAPDLTAIGARNLGIDFEIRHLKCPSCVNPGSPMPPFESLGPKRLQQLAIFLEASKGRT
jgi:hypothetical protein